jgi:sugar phosphate isomerase/epimerase
MKFGVYNAILHDRSLPEAIEVIAKLGLTGIELNSGGFLPPVHIPTFDDILSSDAALDDFLGLFEGTGVEIAGLNCNGNPLHPDPAIGSKHAEDVRRSIRLANRLGQHRVVTMSGLPAGEPGGRRPNWIVNAWNSAALDVLDYQWSVAEEFWREIDREAADLDVKVALELHPQNLVFNPAAVRELVERIGATSIGVELDASHLFWQWMDPVAVVQDLGPLVFHAAAKDVRVNPAAYSTTGSAGWVRTSRARTSVATSGPTSGRRTPRGTSSHWAAGTTRFTGRPGSPPCTRSTPTCS